MQQRIIRALGTHTSQLHFPDSHPFMLCSLFLSSQSSSHTFCLTPRLAVLSCASKALSLPFPQPGPFIFPSPGASLSYLRMSPRLSSESTRSRGWSPPQLGLWSHADLCLSSWSHLPHCTLVGPFLFSPERVHFLCEECILFVFVAPEINLIETEGLHPPPNSYIKILTPGG